MAGDIPPILIDVQVEMGKVKSQLDTLQSEIKAVGNAASAQESKVGGLESKLGKMAGAFKKIAGAAAVGAVLTASAKAAGEDAQSMALLNKQLELSVGANKEQMAAVDASIQKMSQAAGIVDDDIRPAYSTLIRATKDVGAAQSLTTLALDAAAAKGKDAEAVASALAKAHNGNTRQLAMLFPELKNSKDMMGDLAAETKGAAAAAADANPIMRLQVVFDQLKESLGKALLPVLEQLPAILDPLKPLFELIGNTISKLVPKVMPLIKILIEELVPVVEYVIEAVMPLVEAIIDALSPAFKKLIQVIKPILEKLLPPLIKLLDKVFIPVLEFLADLLANYLIPWIARLAEVIGGGLTFAVDAMVAGFQTAQKVLGPFWENVLKPLIDGMMGLIGVKVEPEVEPTVNLRRAERESQDLGLDYSGYGSLKKVVGAKPVKDAAAVSAQEQAKAIQKAQADFQKATLKAQDDYQKAITDRVKDFKKSFEDATKVDIAQLFNAGYQTAETLVQGLKDKLIETKAFAANIGKLSAANYGEDFIKQLESLGPTMGNLFAEQLLSEAPGVQDELKALFSESQLISTTGVDAVAKNLIPTFADATTRLGNAMVDAANGLEKALGKIAKLTPAQISTLTTQSVQGAATTTTTVGGKPPIIVNTNVNNSGSSATEIAASIVSAIKFNAAYTLQDVTQLANNLANQSIANLQAEWANPYGGNF